MPPVSTDAPTRPDIADPRTYADGVPHEEFARRRSA